MSNSLVNLNPYLNLPVMLSTVMVRLIPGSALSLIPQGPRGPRQPAGCSSPHRVRAGAGEP